MARYKPYKYDQMVMVPVLFQDQLEPGTLESTINELVEQHIDLSVFEARYQNDSAGAKAIHPKLLLKVILFAYSRGMISSRQIERACRENILFMALSGGYRPDHSTLAHFVSSMQTEIESIFGNILLVCAELDLLGGTHFSLDGVKLPSNASKEWSGTFKELKQKRDKLQAKLQKVITEHIRQDGLSNPETDRHHQQEKRLLHQVARLNEFLQEEQPKIGKGRKEIQSNLTDNQWVECARFAWTPDASRVEMVCAEDLRTEIVRRRATFQWRDTARPNRSNFHAVQKITLTGSTHFPWVISAK